MKYRKPTRGLNIKKLWRYRYRLYATIVIFFSVFMTHSDSLAAVNVLVPKESGVYNITEQNLLAKKVEKAQAGDTDPKITQVIYRDGEQLMVGEDGFLVTDGKYKTYLDNKGYAYQTPTIEYPAIQIANENEQGQENENEEGEEGLLKDIEYVDATVGTGESGQSSLSDVLAAPDVIERTNYFEYPRFGISAPLVYTTDSDLFNKNSDGSIDYTSPIIEDPNAAVNGNYTSTPVLQKLLDGIVHMNFTPQPGELGNAYLVGHSANYTSVQGPYREIFKDLVDRSQPGDEFFIWDQFGRKLKFRVFENEEVRFDEAERAYAFDRFNDRRVITLQTCKSSWNGSGWVADKRWLVRAELVVE